ncbi:MAG: energy transducer TonB [Myxococcota bacterium]|nr:energy transducer TonB [Myxococcota bacterium]
MRSRDVTIPLALWLCAAVCAHFVFGTGGVVIAQIHDDQSELRKLSHAASSLANRDDQTFEVSLGGLSDDENEKHEPPPLKPEAIKTAPAPAAPTATEKPRPTPPQPEPKRVLVVEKTDENKPPPLPDPVSDHRIAVRQHSRPDQQDNPEAKFIADQANHVANETAATQTSHDRDDENPTPGGNHPGSEPQPGDSEKTRIAESEEHKGVKNRAPGEKGTDVDVVQEPKIPRAAAQPIAAAPQPASAQSPGKSGVSSPASAPRPGAPPQPVAGGSTPASPDVENVIDGTWTFNPLRTGGAPGTTAQSTGSVADPTTPGGRLWALPGLGQPSRPGAMNVNLSSSQMAAVVGSDNLRKLREADGERRKSEHRGAWTASNFDRWRSAIENYVSSVKPGNQTALNTAGVPFASYLNGMHNRIHPIFADSFLDSLDSLPPRHPMNDQHLVTSLEIVLTREGHLKKMGVVKTSGITAFDIAALDAIDRAQPFGPAPKAIVSPDGNVYLHWEFHRDEVYACSTMNARPFILNVAEPKNEDPLLPPSQPTPNGPTREHGAPPSSPNDAREGSLPPSLREGVRMSGRAEA